MSARLLDGVALGKAIRAEVAEEVARLSGTGRRPGLAVVIVGDDPASQVYVRCKGRACEEAGILPNMSVLIEDLQPDRPATAKQSRYRVTVVDNGPGIVRKQVENVFGRLLFGS